MAKSVRNILATIGKESAAAGTEAARTAVIPIPSLPGVQDNPEKSPDPAITARNMTAGTFVLAKDLGGSIPLAPRACKGMGMLLNSALGEEVSTTQIAAIMKIRYSGTEDSCKISAVATEGSEVLTAEVGDLGSETGDTNFGTSGDIDLTAVDTDTVSELVTEIDGYSDYEAELVSGDGTTDAGEIQAITSVQGKDRWIYVIFESADSGIYLHKWEVVLGNTERTTYSIQFDGFHSNYLDLGNVVDQMSFSGALKGYLEGSCNVLGFGRTDEETASELTMPDAKPFITQEAGVGFGGSDQNFWRNFSIDITNNHNPEGYGGGSFSRQYHEKGAFAVTGSFQFAYAAAIYALRAKVYNNNTIGANLELKGGLLGSSLYEYMILDMPYIELGNYEEPENNAVIDANIPFTVVYPSGDNIYSHPFTVMMITEDSGGY